MNDQLGIAAIAVVVAILIGIVFWVGQMNDRAAQARVRRPAPRPPAPGPDPRSGPAVDPHEAAYTDPMISRPAAPPRPPTPPPPQFRVAAQPPPPFKTVAQPPPPFKTVAQPPPPFKTVAPAPPSYQVAPVPPPAPIHHPNLPEPPALRPPAPPKSAPPRVPTALELRVAADTSTLDRLRHILYELPFKAGAGTVTANLVEAARATLHYYEWGLANGSQGRGLPIGVLDESRASASTDVAAIAGYLELEQRLGRITRQIAPDQAATLLMGALAAHALGREITEEDVDSSLEFAEGMVGVLIEGIGSENGRFRSVSRGDALGRP